MRVLVDDVGSFPLPKWITRKRFDETYVQARQAIIEGQDLERIENMKNSFYNVVIDSFRKKLATGLDVVNYPQHYDMHKQILDQVQDAMRKGTYEVDRRHAVLPEIYVINREARNLYREFGRRISLRVCLVGPMELYLKIIGSVAYEDVLLSFGETVRRYAENSLLDSKFIKTEVVSLDEPSFGFREVSASKALIVKTLEKAFNFSGTTKQIHLHSSSRITDILNVRNLDVLSFEYGASPTNIESVSKKGLDDEDKLIRVGIARTDIDAIRSELHDVGISGPNPEQMVESTEVIRSRFATAKRKYGDRLAFAGPDCGLGGWPSQESALLLLKRTVNAVKEEESCR